VRCASFPASVLLLLHYMLSCSASHYGGDTDWKLLNEAAADVARFKV
jgi:hypothetical protein